MSWFLWDSILVVQEKETLYRQYVFTYTGIHHQVLTIIPDLVQPLVLKKIKCQII